MRVFANLPQEEQATLIQAGEEKVVGRGGRSTQGEAYRLNPA